jgi:hypothetical protein
VSLLTFFQKLFHTNYTCEVCYPYLLAQCGEAFSGRYCSRTRHSPVPQEIIPAPEDLRSKHQSQAAATYDSPDHTQPPYILAVQTLQHLVATCSFFTDTIRSLMAEVA